jgi:hypothetical protein
MIGMRSALLLVATALFANTAVAGLGWTYAECVKHYGNPTGSDQRAGLQARIFEAQGFVINAAFGQDGKVISICYTGNARMLNDSMIQKLLHQNGQEPGEDIFWFSPEERRNGLIVYEAFRGVKRYDGEKPAFTAMLLRVDIDSDPSMSIWKLQIDTAKYNTIVESQEANAASNL